MANVESMIVEEKPQTKQIDREKVCFIPTKKNRLSILIDLFADLPITFESFLFYWSASFCIRIYVR